MLIDITRTIGFDDLTYPGDDPPRIIEVLMMKDDIPWNLSDIYMSEHTGTHLDAPLHMIKDGKDLNDFKLHNFIHNCLVIKIKSKKSVTLNEIKNIKLNNIQAVLFKTANSNFDRKEFHREYVYLEDEIAVYLKNKKIRLVGIDYPSVDAFSSGTLMVHIILMKNNILILEDVNLKDVKPGRYKLYCLPIKIHKATGAPCRAFLETY
jgi:arylformamidase